MLRIENLHFSYNGTLEVLKGINLEQGCGIGCILGPNGAGKSTLLKTIVGILQPDEGKIFFNGNDLTELKLKDRAKQISYVPQEFSLNFPYTVFETVLVGRHPHINAIFGPKQEDEKIVMKYLRMLNLENLKDKLFVQLSSGQKRLVLIARGLAQESELIVLDEPTSFLDFKNSLLALSVVENISRKLGKMAILSLHDPNLASLFCDIVFLIKDGTIIDSGKPEKVINPCNMKKLFDLETEEIKTPQGKYIIPVKDSLINFFE